MDSEISTMTSSFAIILSYLAIALLTGLASNTADSQQVSNRDRLAPKPNGNKDLIPITAIARLNSPGGKGGEDDRGVSGVVTFRQKNFPAQPVLTGVHFRGLPVGQYALQIHYFGDIGDGCESGRDSGRRWHLVDRFSVGPRDEGKYDRVIKDSEITIRKLLEGIVGRAISLIRTVGEERVVEVVACDVIGIAGEEVTYYYKKPEVRIRNPFNHQNHFLPRRPRRFL